MTQQLLLQVFRFFLAFKSDFTVQPLLCFGTNIKLPSYWNVKTLPAHTYTHSAVCSVRSSTVHLLLRMDSV